MTNVRISDLRQALDRALDAVELDLGPEVAMDLDYYWHLPVEAAFTVYDQPSSASLTMGSLVDDLDEVASREPDSVAAWHDLVHLIGVLRALELRCLQ